MADLREFLLDRRHYLFNFRHHMAGMSAPASLFLKTAHHLRTSDILGVLTAERKLSESERVGAVGGCLAGGDQLVRCRHGIMDLADNLQHEIFRKRTHRRPVLDVGAELDLHIGIGNAVGVKHAVRVNIAVKMILVFSKLSVEVRRGSQHALVRRSGCDRPRIHQRNRRNLTVLELASLSVREVSCRVADAEGIVCRCVSCAEARAAECRLHNCTCLQNRSRTAVSDKLHVNRHGRRVYAQRKTVRADIASLEYVSRRTDILKATARTAGDDSLIYHESAVLYLVLQMIFHRAVKAYLRALLGLVQNIHKVRIQFFDRIGIAGMEGHSDHRADLGQIDLNHSVIVSNPSGL